MKSSSRRFITFRVPVSSGSSSSSSGSRGSGGGGSSGNI